jgi:hypothetical protein
MDAYHVKAKPLKADLRDQKLIYEALADNPGATVADIRSSVAEMRRIRDQLSSLRDELRGQLRENGLPDRAFRGHHRRAKGHAGWGGNGAPCWDGGKSFKGGRHSGDRHDGFGRHDRGWKSGWGHKGGPGGPWGPGPGPGHGPGPAPGPAEDNG